MFEITARAEFSASHLLAGYNGPCGKLHGHNYRVQASAEGEVLDELGMVLDLKILKRALNAAIAPLDHAHLNDLPQFASVPPSAENIAKYIFESVRAAIAEEAGERAWMREVLVAESDNSWVIYRP